MNPIFVRVTSRNLFKRATSARFFTRIIGYTEHVHMVRISSDSPANAVIIGIGVSFDILMESLTHTFLSSVIRFHLQVDDLFVTLELARCGVLPRVGSSD